MISDTLADAAEEIRWYLEKMPEAYAEFAPRIDRLLTEMNSLRVILEIPPSAQERGSRDVFQKPSG